MKLLIIYDLKNYSERSDENRRLPQDLRIAPASIASASVAADGALLMPNINDDFTGKGPDMGAYEIGKPLPHYGPRPRDVE